MERRGEGWRNSDTSEPAEKRVKKSKRGSLFSPDGMSDCRIPELASIYFAAPAVTTTT
jgi:hypothetical protein